MGHGSCHQVKTTVLIEWKYTSKYSITKQITQTKLLVTLSSVLVRWSDGLDRIVVCLKRDFRLNE